MAGLPTGVVTLLFSDIEGSTALLSRLGSEYADALDAQRDLLRAAWVRHGGIEMGTEGDSFYVAFESAVQAASAAVDGQRALARHSWPRGEAVRVRIGMHTGSPLVHGDAYVGMDVHRAARVAAAGHGGQIVLSDATARVVDGRLPAGSALVDLGAHRLKDLAGPERLHQLAVAGLQSDFPPPKTLGAISRLPAPPTPLVGRDADVAAGASLLSDGEARLVTLTGPGGSGKTRLAVAVAERLWPAVADGVYFAGLATATGPASAWPIVGEALGLPSEARTAGGVADAAASMEAVFVLDNLEQVVDADLVATRLLAASPRSCVIVTSRRPLHAYGEHEVPVPPLDLPAADGLAEIRASPAVQLFVASAQRVRPSFELTADNAAAVVALCRRLDGLPLGLELAAARIKLLGPSALLSRLGSALDIVATTRGEERQRTLRSTISWSYGLLPERSRAVFRGLGVFSGGADLTAVAAVSQVEAEPLDEVSELLDASLVLVVDDPSGAPRVVLLETVRQYALDLLERSGELEAARDRHAAYYLQVGRDAAPMLYKERHADAAGRIAAELGNVREALNWTLPASEPPGMPARRRELGVELCAEVGIVWTSALSYLRPEGPRWTRRAIERDTGADRTAVVKCLTQMARVLLLEGQPDDARDKAARAVEMARRIDDTHNLVDALIDQAGADAERGALSDARNAYDEALLLAEKAGDPVQRHAVLGDIGVFVSVCERDHERALALTREALALARELASPYSVVIDRHNIACYLRLLGRLDEARDQMRELIPDALRLNVSSHLMYLAEDFAAILAAQGESRTAARLLGSADALHDSLQAARPSSQQADIAEPLASACTALGRGEWEAEYQRGYRQPIDETLSHACMDRVPGQES